MKPLYQKILTYAVLPVCILVLAYFCVDSIMRPVKFNDEKAAREQVAIQILKDIRTLQVGFKSTYGHYSPTADSLIWFYNNGFVEVTKQIGSEDDDLSAANKKGLDLPKGKYEKELSDGAKEFLAKNKNLLTAKKKMLADYKKAHKNKKITDEDLFELFYNADGTPKDPNFPLHMEITTKIPVKDTLCSKKSRPDFDIRKIKYIPFTNDKDTIIYAAEIKTVSGVKVPLFEAAIPYAEKKMLPYTDKTKAEPYVYVERLLKGMNHQLIVNLCEERIDTDRYPGLKVGSITAPNNNAGNWE